MQSETRVKCPPKCGREHSIMVNPSLLEEAAKGGLAQIAIPCGDHVLLAYVDRYGMVRRTSTTLLVTGGAPPRSRRVPLALIGAARSSWMNPLYRMF